MKKLTSILIVSTILCTIISCGGKTASTTTASAADNSKLKGYMIAGIYTINGYGGWESTEAQIDKDNFNESAAQILSFPFEVGTEGVKETLASMWDINNKEDLLKRLDNLLNDDKSKYKAWNYARLVNNVNMGYAAGYLTKTEGQSWIDKTLPKAQSAFKTWDEFFANFIEGRKNWNSEDTDADTFEQLCKQLPGTELYKNNPLNK